MAEKYGPQERAALLVLMVENKEIPNPDLVKSFGVTLRKDGREKLNKDGLLESPQVGRRIVHRITADGIAWCENELANVELPAGKGALVSVVFEVFRRIARHLRQQNIRLVDVIHPADLDALIRRAYSELSEKPQEWVRLAQLRPKLNGAAKAEVDQTLLGMMKDGFVHLAPDSDRRGLTDADHAAAIRIGKEDKHFVAIEES